MIKYLPGRFPADGARYVIFLLHCDELKEDRFRRKLEIIVALKKKFRFIPFKVDVGDPDEPSNITSTRRKTNHEREFHSSLPIK